MNVPTVMLLINRRLSMTAKGLDPVVISAYVPNKTARRKTFYTWTVFSVEIRTCEINLKKKYATRGGSG